MGVVDGHVTRFLNFAPNHMQDSDIVVMED